MSLDEEYLQKLMRTLSHDIGAALRAATGFSTLLENKYQSELDEKAHYWLSLIRSEGEQAQDKLKALSRYARLYGIEAEKKECSLSVLCEKVVSEELSTRYPDFKIDVGDLPIFKGYDFLWLEFFREILFNSAQYSGGNSCHISQHDDGNDIVIVVEDDGKGIESARLEHALLPFRTVEGSEGMGIGLSVAKRIVELHHGRFSLSSESGLCAEARFPKSTLQH